MFVVPLFIVLRVQITYDSMNKIDKEWAEWFELEHFGRNTDVIYSELRVICDKAGDLTYLYAKKLFLLAGI